MGWRLEVLMVVTVVLLLVMMMLVGWSSAAGNNIHTDPDAVHQHDVCEDNGAALLCPPDHVVQVQGARCAGVKGLRPCESGVLDTLFRLCHGRRTCSGLDLAQVFGTLCHHSTVNGGHLVVGYTCRRYAPTAAPPCVANLCSNVTRGLRCPGGSVLHVRNVTCGQGGEEPCALATFLMLYSLCEGRGDCDARGLRMLRPLSMYCRHQAHPELRHVFVDFVCLPHDVVQSQCLPRAANLTAPFGLLMSPGFPVHEGKPSNRDRQCDWLLASRDPGDVVHVMVHMAYSRWQARNCRASHFLRVDYRDCRTKQRIVREFCDLSDVNIPITSCGDVRVTSWLLGGSGDSSRFLLSYLVVPRGGQVAPPRGTLECQTSLATPPPPTLTHALTTRPTFSRRNYGPGRTMFDYSDTIRHMGTESDMSEQAEDDTFQLKLILLYIFFGVVILALIIALIYVLMSYRGISRRGRHGSDSSEKTALWRHEDTPLHTFSQNSHATLADVANDLYAPSPPPTRHVEHGDMGRCRLSRLPGGGLHSARQVDRGGGGGGAPPEHGQRLVQLPVGQRHGPAGPAGLLPLWPQPGRHTPRGLRRHCWDRRRGL
ncbi:uncharacterized protein LOC143298920 [Babylonia areolata]|uniref:uncharacterized protein LOC143298920 n=1 Tax=Babylonia areolata TaxID=304850 RepID=UPI003FD4E3E7